MLKGLFFDVLAGTVEYVYGTEFCPTPLGRSAGRPDPTCPWYVRVLHSTGFEVIGIILQISTVNKKVLNYYFMLFPDILCMKRVYRNKTASFHYSAAKNKERFSSC